MAVKCRGAWMWSWCLLVGPTSSFQNRVRRVASRIPFIRRLSIQYNESTGLHLDSPRAMRRLLEALNRSRKDLRAMLKLLENGKMLDGRSYIIHNARDPLPRQTSRSGWHGR